MNSITFPDSYRNLVEVPGHTGPSTADQGEQYVLIRGGSIVSDGVEAYISSRDGAIARATELGYTPIAI